MTTTIGTTRTAQLVRRPEWPAHLVELEVLAHEAGLHPDVACALLRLGLIEPAGGTGRALLFPRDAGARLARAARLRRDRGLSYSGAVLACELLTRIDDLEQRLFRYEPPNHRSRS
jgi:hypothetical protein